MKILLSAAKTGGHIYPAISVGSELKKDGHEVVFLGSGAEIELNALKDKNFSYYKIPMEGFRGKNLFQKLKSMILIPTSIFKTILLIKKEGIDAMIGFGGFITVPSALSFFLARKPIFTHEQNAILGTANKLISKISKINFLAFPMEMDVHNGFVSGNPIREGFKKKLETQKFDEDTINIYVTGGSQGAKYINEQVPKCFSNINKKIIIKHQCGKNNFSYVHGLYKNVAIDVEVKDFYEDPESQIEWADFVVTRAGALSISEISSMGKGMIMIPLPSSIDNHQFFNAKHIEDIKMGVIHLEKDGINDLIKKMSEIINQKIYNNWKNGSSFDNSNAASLISSKVIEHLT